MGDAVDYDELRARVLRSRGRPAPAPRDPATLQAVLDEFSRAVAPHTVSAYHPRSFGYFTPPPLLASVAGEVLAQVAQQGIDIWHAGPIGAFVEEEVLRWLCDLVGYGEGSFGILTSGGVMANFIAMALVARRAPRRASRGRGPRRRAGERSRASASTPPTRRTSRSGGRSTSSASRPRRWRSCRPTTDFRLRGDAVAEAIARDRAAGPAADRDRGGRGLDEHRLGRRPRRARRRSPRREGLWLHVDAAYGAAARLSARDAGRVRGPRAGRLGHGRPAQVAVPGLRHRRADGARRAALGAGVRRPAAGVLPRRPRAEGTAPAHGHDGPTDDDGHGAADQLNFWRLGFEGTRRWRALKLWLSWKHVGSDGLRPAGRGERRPGGPPRGANRRHPTTSRRCPPTRRSRSCASGTSPTDAGAGAGPRRGRARCAPGPAPARRSRRPARAGSRRPACAARRTSAPASSTRNRRRRRRRRAARAPPPARPRCLTDVPDSRTCLRRRIARSCSSSPRSSPRRQPSARRGRARAARDTTPAPGPSDGRLRRRRRDPRARQAPAVARPRRRSCRSCAAVGRRRRIALVVAVLVLRRRAVGAGRARRSGRVVDLPRTAAGTTCRQRPLLRLRRVAALSRLRRRASFR